MGDKENPVPLPCQGRITKQRKRERSDPKHLKHLKRETTRKRARERESERERERESNKKRQVGDRIETDGSMRILYPKVPR